MNTIDWGGVGDSLIMIGACIALLVYIFGSAEREQ